MKYVLGAIERNWKNGTPVKSISGSVDGIKTAVEMLIQNTIDRKRVKDPDYKKGENSLIGLTPYLGVRGEFSKSNTFFIDIDTTEGVDDLISRRNELFRIVPNILFIQQSSSKKLHIVCTHNKIYDDSGEWSYNTVLYTCAAIELIGKHFGINYIKKGAIDWHSYVFTSLLYISPNSAYFNDYCTPVKLKKKDISTLESLYEEEFNHIEKKWEGEGIKSDITGKYADGDGGRICVDRDLKIGDYSGNDIRWRISRIAVEVWGDVSDAKEWCDRHFYYSGGSIFSKTNPNIPINQAVLRWLVVGGYLNIKEIDQKKQTAPNYQEIQMKKGEWMSNYIDLITQTIKVEKVITVDAPTGTGKTTMIKEATKLLKKNGYKEIVVLVPFNATNHLYNSLNVVSSENDNEYKKGGVNVMVWDQFYKRRNEIQPDIVMVDESHTLFTDRIYRDSAIRVYEMLHQMVLNDKFRLVFISATPAGEVAQFNSYVMKFIQKDKRDIKIEVHFANDTGKCIMRDLRKGKFDRICVFSDKDAQLAYAQSIERGYDAVIYHSAFRDNVKKLGVDERLHNKISFLTCIAFNGLNIRNSGEKILIDMRWTVGETSLNEISQVLGRFRANDDITLRLYVDGKWERNEDIDETYRVAKVIMESDSLEVKNDYWERMAREEVYSVRKEMEVWDASQTIEWIVGSLMKMYGKEKVKLYKDEARDGFSRTNPLKKKASDAFKKYVVEGGELDEDNHFVKEFRRSLNHISSEYGVDAFEFLKKLLSGKGSDRMVDTILGDLSGIFKVISFSDEAWEKEKENRKTLIANLNNSEVVKGVMSKFKIHDQWRKKYSGWQLNAVLDDQLDLLWGLKEEHDSGRSKGGKVVKRNAVKKITDGVRVWDSCKEASIELGCGLNTITNRIKKGVLWEC